MAYNSHNSDPSTLGQCLRQRIGSLCTKDGLLYALMEDDDGVGWSDIGLKFGDVAITSTYIYIYIYNVFLQQYIQKCNLG